MLTSSLFRSLPAVTTAASSFRAVHTLSSSLSLCSSELLPRATYSAASTAAAPSTSNKLLSSFAASSSSVLCSANSSSVLCCASVSPLVSSALRSFATAKAKKDSSAKKSKSKSGKSKKGKSVKAEAAKAGKKKAAVAKRPQLSEEQRVLKKERAAKKKLDLKHSEDRLKAQFIRSIQPATKRAASPLIQYISETMAKVRAEKNLSPAEAVKEAARRYKELTEAQKQKYVKKFEQQKAALKEEWDKYNAKYGYPSVPNSSWMEYFKGRRVELVRADPALNSKEKLAELSRQVAAEWNKMSDADKKNNKFFDSAKYEAALQEYHEKKKKIDDKLLAQFNQWKESRAARKQASKAKREAAIESS